MTEEQLNRKLFGISNKVENFIPPQAGKEGKVLSTDGTKTSWVTASLSSDAVEYTQEEKDKLAGIAPLANRYIHPSSHPASIISNLDVAVYALVESYLQALPGYGFNKMLISASDGFHWADLSAFSSSIWSQTTEDIWSGSNSELW